MTDWNLAYGLSDDQQACALSIKTRKYCPAGSRGDEIR
jgi:hypothetical protein